MKTHSPFEIFNIEKTFQLSLKELEKTYYDLSRQSHPDRFVTASKEMQQKSQEFSSLLNQSFTALRDPERRLEVLLKEAGVWKPEDQGTEQKQIPTELAEEFFELQEGMSENPEKTKSLIQDFKKKLTKQNEGLTYEIYELAKKTNWNNPSRDGLEKILELRKRRSYIQSMIENLEQYV